MKFRFVADVRAMQEAAARPGLGLLEPSAQDPEALPGEIDVIVVPALAVDPSGQRLGYGSGHYDATLPRFAPPATTIAVAFDFQLLAELPATPDDVSVAWVVTDARTIECRGSEGS